MVEIELRGIKNHVLNNLDLRVADGELLVVVGPNGAGKTTLLNVIAGLIDYEGTVLFDGDPVDEVPVERRGIGYLFQNLAIFPHLDVASNVGYGLMVRNKQSREIMQKVDELLGMVKINHLKHRYPKNLSGGERQRVALARAFAISPKVLLLDEPFNSLDGRMCRCLRREIRQIQREGSVTTIFVTHNPEDAKEMGDRIVVLNEGKIKQVESTGLWSMGNGNRSQEFQECLHCKINCYCKSEGQDLESSAVPFQ